MAASRFDARCVTVFHALIRFARRTQVSQSKPGYGMLQEYNCSHLLPSSLSAGCVRVVMSGWTVGEHADCGPALSTSHSTASTYCNCNMPQPAEDVIDLTNDSEHEDVMQPPAPGPRPNRAHVPRPLSTAARQQLYKAIESCPEDKLRDILANMVADDAVSTRTLFDNLVVVNPPRFPALEVQHPRLDPVPVLPVVAGQAPIAAYIPAPHRVVPRWATCAHCGEDFDAADEQEEDECVYHSGMTYSCWYK